MFVVKVVRVSVYSVLGVAVGREFVFGGVVFVNFVRGAAK